MTDLKVLYMSELLDALDIIYEKTPVLLDHWLETEDHMDIQSTMSYETLAMTIINLRDTVNTLIPLISKDEYSEEPVYQISQKNNNNLNLLVSPALALFMHINMLSDPESIYYSPVIGTWPNE